MAALRNTGLHDIDAGGCPAPFLSDDLHPYTGGFWRSRNCNPNILSNNTNASFCCLPCPVIDFIYPDNFRSFANGAAWTHVASFILCTLLLFSMIVFPNEARRAYLNIVLLVGVLLFDLGFIVPLARKPPECYDAITASSQDSNFTCAISGALVAFGALFLVTWILIRAIFMHLQICWSFTSGPRSYIAANVAALSVTIVLTAAVLATSGVSVRWGHYCHINPGSIPAYWGWLLSFGGLSFLLQVATFAYVIKVYVASAVARGNQRLANSTSRSGSLQSLSRGSVARATARRVHTVILLQWRSLAIVFIAIFTVTFVCLVIIVADEQVSERAIANNGEKLLPWVICLVRAPNPQDCLSYIKPLIISESLIVGTLFLEGFVGIMAFILLCRVDIFKCWWKLLRTTSHRIEIGSSRESETGSFVSIPQNEMNHWTDKSADAHFQSHGLADDENDVTQTFQPNSFTYEEPGPLQRNPVIRQGEHEEHNAKGDPLSDRFS